MWLPLLFCATPSCALDGQVVEKTTGKPMPGVFVIARWKGDASVGVQPATTCYRAKVLMTDADGKFEVPEWSGSLNPFRLDGRRYLAFYTPGYREASRTIPRENLVTMEKRRQEDREQSIADIYDLDVGMDCGLRDEKQLAILKAKYAELSVLAVTRQEKEKAFGTKYAIDVIEQGETVARRNLDDNLFRRKSDEGPSQ
jgi:hypothetical protein